MAISTPLPTEKNNELPDDARGISHAGRAVTEAEYWEKYYDLDDII